MTMYGNKIHFYLRQAIETTFSNDAIASIYKNFVKLFFTDNCTLINFLLGWPKNLEKNVFLIILSVCNIAPFVVNLTFRPNFKEKY